MFNDNDAKKLQFTIKSIYGVFPFLFLSWYIIISKHRDVGGMKFTASFVDTLIKESCRKHNLNMDTSNLDEKY